MKINLQWLQDEMARRGEKLDAGETAALARQLEYVYAKTYDVVYPELKARKFIPVDTSVDSGAEFFTYKQWDQFGMATIISNFADDLPRVDVLAKEYSAPIKSLGVAYGYSIQDLRRAAMSGSQLDNKRALATRRASEQAVDEIAAFGNAAAGLGGFTNNANVPIVAPNHAPWSAATPLEIVNDVNTLVNSIVAATLETFVPESLICDSTSFSILNTRPMSATGDSDKTILRFILDNNPYIRNIDQWIKQNDAGAADVTRLVCYKRDPEVLELVIPQEYEQFPPQARNLEFVVPTHSRIGGVSVRYPLAMAYMDATGE